MVVKDGNKYACDSCIRGHRVSGCNHTDRELHFIAPKGRPVKQCDHCRGARKSKSHHAKCDCGGRKERGEVKLGDVSCCCTLGDNCICGMKHASDLRLDTSHSTLSKASHGRPPIVKGTSEGHLTTYINERNKACHKLKHSTQSTSMPYPNRKMHAGSDVSNTPNSMEENGMILSTAHRGSKDDSALLSTPTVLYSTPVPAQVSVDNLPLMSLSGGSLFQSSAFPPYTAPTTMDAQNQLTFSPNDASSEQFFTDLMTANSATSPADDLFARYQCNTCGQVHDDKLAGDHASFSPADLPLTSSTFAEGYPQPTSFSDESNAQSAPGLTTASSTTHSELGDANTLLEASMGNTFDAANVFQSGFDLLDMPNFGNVSPSMVQKSMPAPTSDPAESSRHSLDAESFRNLSTYAVLNDGVESYFDNSAIVNTNGTIDNEPLTPALSYESLRPASELSSTMSTFNNQPTTKFKLQSTLVTRAERPISMPVQVSAAASYNPNTTINNLYPQLDEDFSAAASWDPSALDLGSSSWQYPMQ